MHSLPRIPGLLLGLLLVGSPLFGRPAPDHPLPEQPANDGGPAPAPGGALFLAQDDTTWYGGTAWAADSLRWEAIRGGRWSFDSGVGSSINSGSAIGKPVGYHATMEGWTGLDQTRSTSGRFDRSAGCAIAGSWSLRAGVDQATADSLC
jgi:hypothetical protein